MNASNLIKSINTLLNEDAYEKLTLSQVYLKLGKRGFLKYIRDMCVFIVRLKKIDLLLDMEFVPDSSYVSSDGLFWGFVSPHKYYDGHLYVTYTVSKDEMSVQCGVLDCYGKIDGELSKICHIRSSDTDLFSCLEKSIQKCIIDSPWLDSKIKQIMYQVKLDNKKLTG